MSYKTINKYCPYFSEGNCKSSYCKYNYHFKCKYNINCFNFECQYGHSVSCNLRKLFKKIVDENTNPQYENSKNKCYYAINCFNTNCMKDHMITTDVMMFINHILKQNICYEDALIMYKLQFKQQSTDLAIFNRIVPVQLVEPVESVESVEPVESVANINPIVPVEHAKPTKSVEPAKSVADIDPIISGVPVTHIDLFLESNLLNLTETEDEPVTPIKNDREDLKSKLLQELMVSQNNIKQLTKELYDKDIEIQTLMNQRIYLESKMYQNRAKVHQLTMNIMNLNSF